MCSAAAGGWDAGPGKMINKYTSLPTTYSTHCYIDCVLSVLCPVNDVHLGPNMEMCPPDVIK